MLIDNQTRIKKNPATFQQTSFLMFSIQILLVCNQLPNKIHTSFMNLVYRARQQSEINNETDLVYLTNIKNNAESISRMECL